MKLRALIVLVLIFSGLHVNATNFTQHPDSIIQEFGDVDVMDPDSVLEMSVVTNPQKQSDSRIKLTEKRDSLPVVPAITVITPKIPTFIEPVKIDSLLLLANPFTIELVFKKMSDLNLTNTADLQLLYHGTKATNLKSILLKQVNVLSADQIITQLRNDARSEISRHAAHLYATTFYTLPDPNGIKSRLIETKSVANVRFVNEDHGFNPNKRRLIVRQERLGPWQHKATTLLQFSQNMTSDNWYQGGSSTMSVLGVLSGQLNYDNKKNVQWENSAEWRMGFYAIFNDSTAKRDINVNEDVLKINSKLGIKAGDNLYYSGSVDFSTQFIHNYKSVSSDVLKASFLTPVRLNIGVGLDYKYKKIFSLMLSPVAFKYIYMNDSKVSPNLYGIATGKDYLGEIGSSFKAQCSFSPFHELQVDSKFSFYTNYEKVEIDWEIIGNFTINRFLSTRLLLNPRYDNTVIGEKAKLQFKELLSFGFAYKLLN